MRILITGGGRGIGLAIAQELYAYGHELLLVSRTIDAKAIHAIFPERVNIFNADLSNAGDIDALVDYAKKIFRPDALVLNAAAFGGPDRSVIKRSVAELRQLLEINVLANYQLVQGLVDTIQHGEYPRIVLIGSTASLRKDSGSLYGISKAALRSFAYGLRSELKGVGVGVTLIHPGGTFTERRAPDERTPPGRLLEASDIGQLVAVLFTLSPQAVVEELIARPMLGDTF